jgi:hypothetical protein
LNVGFLVFALTLAFHFRDRFNRLFKLLSTGLGHELRPRRADGSAGTRSPRPLPLLRIMRLAAAVGDEMRAHVRAYRHAMPE